MSDARSVAGRRRGRPPSTTPKAHLTVYVPVAYATRLAQLAVTHGVSVSTVVCRVLDLAARRRDPRDG